jgi:hypothetical protein
MSRQLPEYFQGKDLIPLCLALKRKEAGKVESLLDGENIDYTFEITPAVGRSVVDIIFGSVKKGVMFLVPPDNYEFSRTLLEKAGIAYLIIE